MVDVGHRGTTDFDGGDHSLETTLDQRNIRCFDGNVRACADGKTDIRLSKRGRVVDTVADHCNLFVFRLQQVNVVCLIFGQYFRQHARDPNLAGNRFSGAAVIACDHHHFNSHTLQGFDRFRRIFLDRVSHGNDASGFAIYCNKHWGLAIVGKRFGFFFQLTEGDLFTVHQLEIADQNASSFDCSRDAVTWNGFKLPDLC